MDEIKEYSLNNGLKVYLNRIKGKGTISCSMWIDQGSKDENSLNNGLSHLVEHLMFKIKCKESNEEINAILDKLQKSGAFYNGTTSKDFTSFYIEGLHSDFEMFIKILSYLVTNKENVKEEDLEKEKKIVLREAEEYLMSSAQMADRIGQAMWGNSDYGNMTIGTYENIKNFTCKMVDELIKNVYTPDNSYMVIVGDFEYSEMEEVIEKYFSNWQGKCNKNREYNLKFQSGIFVDNRFKGNRTTFGLGFPGYPITNVNFQYIEILKNILINMDSNLLIKLREERGLVYSLKGFTNAFSKTGNIGIVFSANNASVEEIVKICMQEFKNLTINGVDPEFFENLKRRRLLEVLFSLESSNEKMRCIGQAAIAGYTFSLKNFISDIKSLNKTKMDEIIREVFKSENLSAAILGSVSAEKIKPLLQI